MIILVINCGSSTLKYRLFHMGGETRVLCEGLVDRLGQGDSVLRHTSKGSQREYQQDFTDYRSALQMLFSLLSDPDVTELEDLQQIQAVGYRVVHGGDRFHQATLIDESVLDHIADLAEYAPLHNPVSVQAIETSREILPRVQHVAVFDTAENQSLPDKAFLYALPAEWHEKYAVRRYGFHGISQRYVAGRAARELHRPLEQLKVISCHLGNGTSVTAFAYGRVVDTSMGLTPLEGLVMATRCGDVDPGAILHVMEKEKLSVAEMQAYLNHRSGLRGLCGRRDMREILRLAQAGDHKAQTAVDVYAYRIRKYIGAYAAVLNGVDVLIFTAGIGENSPEIRCRILSDLDYLGVVVDDDANEANSSVISARASAVTVVVVPTNEELAIAEQTYALLSKTGRVDNAV